MSTETSARRGRVRSRGFALLIVLWALALAALIGAQITALSRRETRIAANLRAAAIVEAAADGAVEEAIFRLMRNEAGWDASGGVHAIAVAGVTVAVAVTSENGKVNINNASPELLTALMQTVGVDPKGADPVVAAIVAWRGGGTEESKAYWRQRYTTAGLDYAPPFEQFQSADELSLVLGVTQALYERLAPHITIYGSGPDPTMADPIVRQALRAIGSDAVGAAPAQIGGTVSIEARATIPDGATFERHAVVRLAGRDGYQILIWDRGGR